MKASNLIIAALVLAAIVGGGFYALKNKLLFFTPSNSNGNGSGSGIPTSPENTGQAETDADLKPAAPPDLDLPKMELLPITPEVKIEYDPPASSDGTNANSDDLERQKSDVELNQETLRQIQVL